MQLSFLCSKHNDWVYGHPEEAIHYLARDESQGVRLFFQGDYRESLPYLGCAFDIAAILLEVEEGKNHTLVEKLSGLTQLICAAYECLGLPDYQAAIKARAQAIANALEGYEANIAFEGLAFVAK